MTERKRKSGKKKGKEEDRQAGVHDQGENNKQNKTAN